MKKTPTKDDLVNRHDVQASIKEKAYLIAESEGFPHGKELIHWLQAEEEVIARHLREVSDMVKSAVVSAADRVKTKAGGNGKTAAPKAAAKPAATKAAAPKTVPKAATAKPKAKPAAKTAKKK